MIALYVEIEHFMKHQQADDVHVVRLKIPGHQVKAGVNNVEIAEDGWCSKIKGS